MIRIEFLGMPRQYANCDSIEVAGTTIDSVLVALATQLPQVAEKCLAGSRVRKGYLLGINGRFDFDCQDQLNSGDTIQLLSADVGGH